MHSIFETDAIEANASPLNPNEETFEKHFGITLDDYYDDMEEQHVAQEEERWGLLTAEVQERRNDYEER